MTAIVQRLQYIIVSNIPFPDIEPLTRDTLWVLRHDELLVHVFLDISLITKHILDRVISLES